MCAGSCNQFLWWTSGEDFITRHVGKGTLPIRQYHLHLINCSGKSLQNAWKGALKKRFSMFLCQKKKITGQHFWLKIVLVELFLQLVFTLGFMHIFCQCVVFDWNYVIAGHPHKRPELGEACGGRDMYTDSMQALHPPQLAQIVYFGSGDQNCFGWICKRHV